MCQQLYIAEVIRALVPTARNASLLDPKLDVVFKLLFAHVNNRDILTALLTAMLKPAIQIDSVQVLNPEVPKDLPGDKGAVLDIHLRLADGRHIDVEMQSELRPGMTQRFLYYWARLHASQLTMESIMKICTQQFPLSY